MARPRKPIEPLPGLRVGIGAKVVTPAGRPARVVGLEDGRVLVQYADEPGRGDRRLVALAPRLLRVLPL